MLAGRVLYCRVSESKSALSDVLESVSKEAGGGGRWEAGHRRFTRGILLV